jgi:hypothetical protein
VEAAAEIPTPDEGIDEDDEKTIAAERTPDIIPLTMPEPEPEQDFRVEIPVLTEEKNPELAPVRVKSAKQKKRERQRAIRRRARRRQRNFLFFVAAICVLVILVAVVWGRMHPTELSFSAPTPAPTPAPTKAPITIIATPEPLATSEPTPEPVREHRYEFVRDDVSWARAAEICRQMGGYLVTVNDRAEFDRIVEMAASSNTPNIWVGCHRENGELVWESGETVDFYYWDEANGEPSGWDSYDNIPEDYVMLWYHNGWYYNDNRNDPAGDYPAIYGGTIGFVCEYDS